MCGATRFCAWVVVGGWFIAGHCLAASLFTWNGLGPDNNWSTGANWTSGESGPPNDGTANVVFAGRGRMTPFVDHPWSIASLRFNSADPFTIGGSALTISS